ncbi:MAG: hypothetical protein ACTSYI_01195 [Promethearchaeota archaeon]
MDEFGVMDYLGHGIRLESSNNTRIYFNIFVENANNAAYCLLSSNDSWDNGIHGNYWGYYEEFYPTATNDGTIWDIPYQIDIDNVDNFPLVIPNSSASPLDTDTNESTDSSDTDSSDTDSSDTDSSDTNIPTNTGGNILGPINPFLAIVGLFILISVSVIAVVKRKKKDGEEGGNYDDYAEEYIDFRPAPPPIKKPKKPNLDLLDEKPYKYDPDEPHL